MQAALHAGGGGFAYMEICAFAFLMIVVGAADIGGAKDGGEVVFDFGDAEGVFDSGIGGLIGNVGDKSEAIIVGPCMSFDDVNLEIS